VPKLGLKAKIGVAAVVCLLLIVLGALFFPVSPPEVHLAPNYDDPFFTLGPIYFTNTLIASCLSVATLILLFYFATRRMKIVPARLQSFAEFIIEALLNFIEGVAGKENGRRFLPIVATIFLYVLANAWLSLLPFFNFIGYGHTETVETLFYGTYAGFIVQTPLFRGANTDINVPLMLALVSFVSVEYWGITSLGLRHYASKFFRFGRLVMAYGQLIRGQVKSALAGLFYGIVDVFVGMLELLSELVRIISFTFRLFGNMFAGEVVILMFTFLTPLVVAIAMYGLELFVGIIQALIFAVLTLVFGMMAVARGEARAAEGEHGEEAGAMASEAQS
jgi:F-type H+-transporting ATPase subunit a